MAGKGGKARGHQVVKPPAPLSPVQQAKLAGAIAAHQKGDLQTAATVYREILSSAPRCFDALHLLGAACIQRGELEEGARLIEKALTVDPAQPHAHSNLSKALLELGRARDALAACDRAVALDPSLADAWYNRANVLTVLGPNPEALADYRRAVHLRPQYPEAWNNLGTGLRAERLYADALAALDEALRLAPHFVNALSNRGLVLADLGRPLEAMESYRRALAIDPVAVEPLNNLGLLLMEEKRHAEAQDIFARLAAAAPHYMYVQGNRLHAALQCCDWRHYDEWTTAVTAQVGRDTRVDFPFSFLCVSGSATLQLRCASAYTLDQYPAVARVAPQPGKVSRLTVAYVSGDFGDHAVSHLLAGVVEAHDRSAVESIALSWGRHGDGAMRARMEAAFERFIDVTTLGDDALVRLMQELGVHIAVDLTGHTRGNRTGVFARRAAPVQVNFLGLPATMGAPYMDYLLADRFLVPESLEPCYAERIARLPLCFQPNDGRRLIGDAPARASLGLPDDAVVLCSFNNPSKLNPPVFSVWMNLLRTHGSAVLWLYATTEAVAANLRTEAAARGVDAARLVFAPRVSYGAHLARLQAADLFLDSSPFNAGATASDALSAAVPVLTLTGDAFAGRMAGSLLHCLGLPELVTDSLAAYEARAHELVTQPGRLAAYRRALQAARSSHPFFDPVRYCRNLEAAYQRMWSIHEQGQPPRSFTLEDAR